MTQRFYRFYGGVLFVTIILGVFAAFTGWMATRTQPPFPQLFMEKYVGSAEDMKPFSDSLEIADDYSLVSLSNTLGDIEVTASKDGKTHLLVEGKASTKNGTKPFGYKLEHGALHIKVDPEMTGNHGFNISFNGMNFGSPSAELNLRLEVPAKFHGDLEMRTINGELHLDGVNGDKAQLKTVNGEIILGAASAWKKIEAETVNGDLSVAANSFDQDIKSVSGDVRAFVPRGGSWNVNVRSVSGDIKDELPRAGGAMKARLQAKTVSGDIDLREGPAPQK